ncbi:hypothetical protein DVH05_020060 [Phytophthora capsici]|nr:hypothetical protein DVH05_020060 [Phytophthora capsici]|eukprot:jgi/Phyca11/127347/e_gw1.68.101.1
MLNLLCAIVGAQGSVFPVLIGESESVGDLKKAIAKMKPLTVTCKADRLQLFLTKTEGGGWLSSKDEVVLATRKGGIPEEINKMLIDEIDPAKEIADVLGAAPTKMVIHVLVVVPRGLYTIHGDHVTARTDGWQSFSPTKLRLTRCRLLEV